jgi:quinol monooxygenase YgiN
MIATSIAGAAFSGCVHVGRNNTMEGTMYGLIGKALAAAGKRDELMAILLEGTQSMPGCLSYIVAKDTADPNGIWITEVWDSESSHKASLALPAVQAAIARGRPLIAGFAERFVTEPLGGVGLPPKA